MLCVPLGELDIPASHAVILEDRAAGGKPEVRACGERRLRHIARLDHVFAVGFPGARVVRHHPIISAVTEARNRRIVRRPWCQGARRKPSVPPMPSVKAPMPAPGVAMLKPRTMATGRRRRRYRAGTGGGIS